MTRFARAKGSKASNEKLREEATPWHVMKQQIEESSNKKKPAEEKKQTANHLKELLEEKEACVPLNNDWAEFEDPKAYKKTIKFQGSSKIEKPTGKKIKKKKLKESFQKQTENNTDLVRNFSEKTKTKKQLTDKSEKLETSKTKIKKPKFQLDSSQESITAPKKKKFNEIYVNETKKNEIPLPIDEKLRTKPTENLSKRQKRNLKKKNQNSEAQSKDSNKAVFETEKNAWNSNVKFGNSSNKFENSGPFNARENNSERGFQRRNNCIQERFGRFRGQKSNMKNQHLRQPKIKDNKEHKRRKPVKLTKLMISGVEIEVVMYDGFPVLKEDAERLKKLKQKMVLKGISKSEIDAAMKLERRKAEKALGRMRKQVCFHCRKSGHNLSDCPELGREESATGICFKCGSTEHTHFECKVMKSDDYRYATCFICREPGHIAKQCPDNPKGLYPKGGACKICGDVTHFKKDCPDAAREKEETTITAKTITDSALESLEEEEKKVKPKKEPKQKIVKF